MINLRMIQIYFLLFMTYSFLGWCMEVGCKLVDEKKFVNRGFLIGPYCPIYGWGVLAIIILLNRYLDDPTVLFVMSIVICSILEYFTSYFMEKIYHARWWDYSQKKFNINGRICLETMLPFGILGTLIMYFVNPIFYGIYINISPMLLNILSASLFVIFIVDNIISTNIISSVDKETSIIQRDNTEEITEKVKQALSQRSILHRRLISAFPNIKNLKLRARKIKDNIKDRVKK